MAKRDKRKDQKVEIKKEDSRTKTYSPKASEKKISLRQSINNLELELLKDDVKDNNQAKFSIIKLIEGLKKREQDA